MNLQGRNLYLRMRGDDVELLQSELRRLGSSIDDEEGFFGKTTRRAVLKFQEEHELEPTGIVDEITAAAINSAVGTQRPEDRQELFTVTGRVLRDGEPLSRVPVRAFDRGLRREVSLGEATTDAEGRYSIRYTADLFARAGKPKADLVVRVGDPETPLVASEVLFSAGSVETVDLVVPHHKAEPSEYERVEATLLPQLEDVPPADLEEDDVAFLADHTGLPSRRISLYADAHRLHREHGAIPPAAFYGMLRRGLSAEPAALAAQRARDLEGALDAAVRENLVPAALADELGTVAEELQTVGREHLASSLNRLLDTSPTPIPSRSREKVLELRGRHGGSTEEFWSALLRDRDLVAAGVVEELQHTLELGDLTGANVPLVAEIQAMRTEDESPSQLLARLDASEWRGLVERSVQQGAKIPPDVPGQSQEERIKNHSRELARAAEEAYPTAFVAEKIRRPPAIDSALVRKVFEKNPGLDPGEGLPEDADLSGFSDKEKRDVGESMDALRREVKMFPALDGRAAAEGDGGFRNPIREGVARFLEDAPDFDLSTTPVDTYLRENASRVLPDADERAKIADQVKSLQRVYQVAPRYDETNALLEEGLDSALSISSLGERAFVQQFEPTLGGEDEARQVHANARQMTAVATNLFGTVHQAVNDVTPQAMGGSAASAELAKQVPDWATLFGRVDLCDCAECRSVYGPAAYLVDLLQFLNPKFLPRGVTQRPAEVLRRRRPDLEHIELSCENTNTTLPYVDLVNEVLEDVISPLPAYSAVGDFYTTSTPGSTWSYGYRASAGSGFTRYTRLDQPYDGFDRWSLVTPEPMVTRNRTGRTISYLTITHPPDVLNLHPGAAGEMSVVRWTAPSSGAVKIEGRFQGIDTGGTGPTGGTTTAVAMVHNLAATLFEGNINGYDSKVPFSMSKSVSAGDTIDFSVGYGSNRTYFNDSTGLSVTIAYVATRQTRGTPEELSVNPEYINANGYEKLARAVFPFSLPFDLNLETVKAYLGHLGTSRHELMDVFDKASQDDAKIPTLERAGEYLSLSPQERRVITGTEPEIVWVEDGLPTGAVSAVEGGDAWNWVSINPPPFSGTRAHQSNVAAGMHQHSFSNATATLAINRGDRLFAYVYLDPANTPEEVMLQWNDGTWQHRAYWGANKIGVEDPNWGTDGTASRRPMGALPPTGGWVRLEVPASQVGLEGRTINGMAFTLYGGRAAWDRAGVLRLRECYGYDTDAIDSPGLAATYFDNPDFTGATVTRVDPAIDFDWGKGSPAPAIAPDTFSARWSGKLLPPATEQYIFYVNKDDGVRLWVDGQLLIDKWSEQPRSFESFNYPGHFIRHLQLLGELSPIASIQDQSMLFRVVPGLADNARCVSFESYDNPGVYLRCQDFRLKLQPRSDDELFRKDATFFVEPGLADPTWTSFRSFSVPQAYLRHRDYHLWVEAGSGDLFRKDATFRMHIEPTEERSGRPITLQKGLAYDLKLEYFEATGDATAKLLWSSASQPTKTTIGPQHLRTTQTWHQHLAWVPEFLKRSGLEFNDLLNLLATRFVNPNPAAPAITLQQNGDPCDLGTTLVGNLAANEGAALRKIHRLLRLWRKADVPMGDLDKAIFAFGGNLDDVFLDKLADARWLQADLKVPLVQILSMWSNLDTHGTLATDASGDTRGAEALYTTLFRNKAVFSLLDPDFALTSDRSEVVGTSKSLDEKVPALLAALRLPAADVAAIRTDADLASSDAKLSLANLSTLHRYALISRALDLSVQDMLSLKRLSGLDPFASPADTRRFIETVRKVRQSGFSVALLDYLLRDVATPTADLAPTAASIDELVRTLREGFARIAEDNAPQPDPMGERLRRLLSTVMDADALERAMQLVENKAVYAAPLSSLPGLRFPDELAHKVSYRADTRELRFAGSMTEAERTRLRSLSTLAEYRSAVESLFRQPRTLIDEQLTFVPGTEARTRLLAPLGPDPEAARQQRRAFVSDHLLAHLRDTQSRALVVQSLSGSLSLEATSVKLLLEEILTANMDPGKPAVYDFQELANAEAVEMPLRSYRRLHKISLLVTTFRMTPEELRYLTEHGADFEYLDLNLLPLDGEPTATDVATLFRQWDRLREFFAVKSSLPTATRTLLDVFRAAQAAGATLGGVLDTLAAATAWDRSDLDAICGPTVFDLTPRDFVNAARLPRIQSALMQGRRLGVRAAQLGSWATAPPDAAQAKSIRETVKAKYDEEAWLRVAAPLSDDLRERQKAALIAYVLQRPAVRDAGITDSNQLFEYLLIDVEMSVCMKTSRIKQAISSVQLFVQRCQLNLERDVPPEAIDGVQWKWMKNYRLWEANRKVFLYPENWIEPELRDDKTPLFEELENELLQNEVTAEMAQAAYAGYLAKLNDIACLEICGLWFESPEDGTPDIVHVFARTFAVPHVYYHRRRVKEIWTAWEKIDVDIQSDHLIPAGRNRRLYLFWPIFTEVTDKQQITMPASGGTLAEPKRRWKIELAWSEYKHGHWSPKRVSSQALRSLDEIYDADATQDRLRYTIKENTSDEIVLSVIRDLGGPGVPKDDALFDWVRNTGDFIFFGGRNAVEAAPLAPASSYAQPRQLRSFPPDTHAFATRREVNEGVTQFKLQDGLANVNTILGKRPTPYRVVAGQKWNEPLLSDSGLKWPFFYQDHQRAYLVQPPGVRFAPHYHPHAAAFLAALNERGIPGLLTLENQQLTELNQAASVVQGMAFTLYGGRATWDRAGKVDKQGKEIVWVEDNVPAGVTQHGDLEGWTWVSTNPTPFSGTRAHQSALVANNTHQHLFLGATDAALKIEPGDKLFAYVYLDPVNPPQEVMLQWNNSGQIWEHRAYWGADRILWGTSGTTGRRYMGPLPKAGEWVRLEVPAELVNLPSTTFSAEYGPQALVRHEPSTEGVAFEPDDAYSLYNWELFFHGPLYIADRLSKEQRFEEAQRWFHYVFDPTNDSPGEPSPRRYWRFRPFNDKTEVERIQELLYALADPNGDDRVRKEMGQQVDAWRDDPFQPHLVARQRPGAYQKAVVMKYIDNLIAWGDQLFARDTIESINEATQLYVLAHNLLGPRPERIPQLSTPAAKTYQELQSSLDEFSNALVEVQNRFPFVVGASKNGSGSPAVANGLGLAPTLYFGIPRNDTLLSYWDKVEDRLFKVRHCLNIEGVRRSLALFEPPVEPDLLVRAAAAGVDLGTALSDLNVPLGHYRFGYLLPKALELCAEAKSLGGALLAALEKKDAETLSNLRARQEGSMLRLVRQVKENQIEEAKTTLEGLRRTRAVTEFRYDHYKNIQFMNEFETAHLALAGTSLGLQTAEAVALTLAGGLYLLPNFKVGAPTSIGITHGGDNIGSSAEKFGASLGTYAAVLNSSATMAATLGGHHRRAEEWKLQEELAFRELQQIDQQIAGAEIRLAIMDLELKNHDRQVANTEEVETFLRDKYTNQDLYAWMSSQLSSLYFQTYQLAYDAAKRAEKAYRFELGLASSTFIRFGYWDSLKKGLLAGEQLQLDLKRLEMVYLDRNSREYELTKQVSLVLHDPLALIALKETGRCRIRLPEELFDLDHPGHYMRRIKSVSITIPCITGPYTGINATLTLLSSRIRTDSSATSPYREQANDGRFLTDFSATQGIATSHANNDAGLFELNFRDERYLPFEGSGAVSEWRLDVPRETNTFDFDTISDVIIKLNYTAREGGALLRRAALEAATLPPPPQQEVTGAAVVPPAQENLRRLFSAKHEFANEWNRFLHPKDSDDAQVLRLDLTPERFPLRFRGRTLRIKQIELFMKLKLEQLETSYREGADLTVSLKPPATSTVVNGVLLSDASAFGGVPHADPINVSAEVKGSDGVWELRADSADIKNIHADLFESVTVDGTTRYHLKPDAIENVFVLCYYSATG